MKKGMRIIIPALAVVLVVVCVMFMSGGGAVGDDGRGEETAKTGSIKNYYSFSGSVELKNTQDIAAEAAAKVREVYVSEKDQVKKGDRLIRLSTGDTIKAGISGEVTKIHVEADDEVKIGEALLSIADFGNLEVKFKVDEYDVKQVHVGDLAELTLNALNEKYECTVADIDKQAVKSGDVAYYMATLETPVAPDMLPGMQVAVKVAGDQADNATLISMEALRFDEYNEAYVIVKDVSGQREAQLTLGVNDGVYVEVVSGLRSGEVVLLPEKASGSGMMMGGGINNG